MHARNFFKRYTCNIINLLLFGNKIESLQQSDQNIHVHFHFENLFLVKYKNEQQSW